MLIKEVRRKTRVEPTFALFSSRITLMLVEASSRLGMLCKYAHTHTSQRCCRRFTWYISAQTSTAIACSTLAKHTDTHTHTDVCQSSLASLFSTINHPDSCRSPMLHHTGAHIHLLAIKSKPDFYERIFYCLLCSVHEVQHPSTPC